MPPLILTTGAWLVPKLILHVISHSHNFLLTWCKYTLQHHVDSNEIFLFRLKKLSKVQSIVYVGSHSRDISSIYTEFFKFYCFRQNYWPLVSGWISSASYIEGTFNSQYLQRKSCAYFWNLVVALSHACVYYSWTV